MRRFLFMLCVAGALVLTALAPANATGTVRVEQSDGSTQTYQNVKITISNKTLRVTSADGKGALVISKAACQYLTPSLLRCFPYSLTLEQGGQSRPLDFDYGTVYVNMGKDKVNLPLSSTQVPPKGIVFAMQSKIGTLVTMTGVVDEVSK